jgi:hypothetical protein
MQPYFDPTRRRKIEEDLKKNEKMEDSLQKNKMEDNLNFFKTN